MTDHLRLSNLGFAGALALAGMVCAAAVPAQALTMQECSAKYKAAKEAGTLGDQKWNDFRKTQCGGEAAAATPKSEAAAKGDAPKEDKTAKSAAAPAAPAGPAVFPTGLSSKYSGETPAKARLHTCLDQYKANKDKNENGGLKWIQKGGGYYSECNKRLKG